VICLLFEICDLEFLVTPAGCRKRSPGGRSSNGHEVDGYAVYISLRQINDYDFPSVSVDRIVGSNGYPVYFFGYLYS
jgi:hypothetical protein